MPEKLVSSDTSTLSHYVGIIGAGISALAGIVGLAVRSFLKKQEKLEQDAHYAQAEEEKLYREGIEKTHTAMWKRIDEQGQELSDIGKQIERLEGRFEDLQRAFERLQQSHFEMSCKNMAGRILRKTAD